MLALEHLPERALPQSLEILEVLDFGFSLLPGEDARGEEEHPASDVVYHLKIENSGF